MTVVVDNNVLSSLAKVDRLELLPDLFADVATTPSVLDELHRDEVAGYQFVDRIDAVKIRGRVAGDTLLERARGRAHCGDSRQFAVLHRRRVYRRRREPGCQVLTDDGHVGEIGSQRDVEVWDLTLLVEACIRRDLLSDQTDLDDLLDDLREKDHYRFSEDDRMRLFEY